MFSLRQSVHKNKLNKEFWFFFVKCRAVSGSVAALCKIILGAPVLNLYNKFKPLNYLLQCFIVGSQT